MTRPQSLRQFPWRCTVRAMGPTPGVDDTGGRVGVLLDPVTDVAIHVQQTTQKDLQEGTVSPGITCLVAFRVDPGPLPKGSTIRVTHRDGAALDRPFSLQVQTFQVEQSVALGAYRADCTGTSR